MSQMVDVEQSLYVMSIQKYSTGNLTFPMSYVFFLEINDIYTLLPIYDSTFSKIDLING